MSIRNFQYLFNPRSVVLVGASQKSGRIGNVLARNLSSAGYDGSLYAVNPNYSTVEGIPTFASVEQLPAAADLAVIATPSDTVPSLIGQLGQRGTKAAVVITAGFAETGDAAGKARQQQLLAAAGPYQVRVVGPNCLGIMVPRISLNASFGHVQPHPGKLAFVAQSGALLTSVLDWATSKSIGFSHCVSLGDMSDVCFADMLDYLSCDPGTNAILLYIESVRTARRFMSAARAAARVKPVVVIKVGRYQEAARAAASHTGALAGSDSVYDAAFRRSGLLRVDSLNDLFGVVGTLALTRPFRGNRLAILTNGGGIGILATDELMASGGTLAELSPETLSELDDVLPPTWSHGNPVDIVGDAPGSRYADALGRLLRDPGVDAVLTLNCPLAIASGTEAAQAVVDTVRAHHGQGRPRGLLTCWLGDKAAAPARRLFRESHIPTYETPSEAIRAFIHMSRYRRNQAMLMETPPTLVVPFEPDPEAARTVLRRHVEAGGGWLPQQAVREVLQAYQIPLVDAWQARTPKDAAALAARLSRSVVLKIDSPDITHKSDVGGVVLDLETPEAVRTAAETMLLRLRETAPNANIDGFTLQPMIRRLNAYEIIVGMSVDPQFGPVLLFGHGGTAVQTVNDTAIALPPLNLRLAGELMRDTRIHRLLKGYRERPPVNLDELSLTLVKISQMICDLAEMAEFEINPLLVDEWGVLGLDVRVRAEEAAQSAADRLAICPYPKELEEMVEMPDGRRLLVRPIRPEDEPAYVALFERLPPEDIRLRFMEHLKSLPHELAARLTQIDYDRQMAFVLEVIDPAHTRDLVGSVRFDTESSGERAEFAMLLRHDMAGKGLGPMLLRRIIDHARRRGVHELYGEILKENTPMIRLSKALGFTIRAHPDDPGVVHAVMTLNGARSAA